MRGCRKGPERWRDGSAVKALAALAGRWVSFLVLPVTPVLKHVMPSGLLGHLQMCGVHKLTEMSIHKQQIDK